MYQKNVDECAEVMFSLETLLIADIYYTDTGKK